MMPIYQAGEMIELRLLCKAQNLQFMNVLHFQIKQTPPLPTTIVDQIRGPYLDAVRLPVATQVLWYAIQTRKLSNGVTEMVTESFTTKAGSIITATTNEFLASIIVLRAGSLGGKPGRMFLPCPPAGQYVLGNMDNNHKAILQTTVNQLNAQFSSTGSNPYLKQVIARRQGSNEWHWNSVNSFEFRLFYGTQKRRRARVII